MLVAMTGHESDAFDIRPPRTAELFTNWKTRQRGPSPANCAPSKQTREGFSPVRCGIESEAFLPPCGEREEMST